MNFKYIYVTLFVIEQILYAILAILAYNISEGNTISYALDINIDLTIYYTICIYLLAFERNLCFLVTLKKEKIELIQFLLMNMTLLSMVIISPATYTRSPIIHRDSTIVLIVTHYINESINIFLNVRNSERNAINYFLIMSQIMVFVLTIVSNSCYEYCEPYYRHISEYVLYNLVIFSGVFRLTMATGAPRKKREIFTLWSSNINDLESETK
jgi:hypothetical protein